MKKEEIFRVFGGVIDFTIGVFFERPFYVWAWLVNIVATVVITILSQTNLFLVWIIVFFAEIILIILLYLYVNFFWYPRRKKGKENII